MDSVVPATDSGDVARWAIAYDMVAKTALGAVGMNAEHREQYVKSMARTVREVYEELSRADAEPAPRSVYEGRGLAAP